MPQYVDNCFARGMESIRALKATGVEPKSLEISSDVWLLIQIGGINMFPGQSIFCGLPVIERNDLTDHIEAV